MDSLSSCQKFIACDVHLIVDYIGLHIFLNLKYALCLQAFLKLNQNWVAVAHLTLALKWMKTLLKVMENRNLIKMPVCTI